MAIASSEVISLANAILAHVGLPRKIETLKQCNSSIFSQLYETLTGSRVPGLSLQAPTSEAVKCQAVVDALNVHLFPHVTLDHIQGVNVAKLDILSLKNLLDVFSVLFHVPLAGDSSGSESDHGGGGYPEPEDNDATTESEDEANDSNLISSAGMSVISEVLREELCRSSHSAVTDSTTELLKPVPVATLPTGVLTTTDRHPHGQKEHRDNLSNVSLQKNEESSSATSQPPSLTISTLHSTSTEASSCHYHGAPPSEAMAAGQAKTAIDSKMNFVPSGESSIGTTPSPKLHTPPQSPRQQRQLSPLHHSTPHSSTRSRLFPFSTSTSTAISSSSSHPLGIAMVTPSVTTHQRRAPQVDTVAEGSSKVYQPHSKQSPPPSNLTTEDSTLLPESSPSPSRSRHAAPELTITDLHTTTMSSGREVDTHHSYSDDSDSTTDSETPPPSRQGYQATKSDLMYTPPTTSRASSAAQKVRFSHSTDQRERARHSGSSLTTSSSDQPSFEVGDVTSIELKLGLDAQVAKSRASVLATLYQNYLSDLKMAQPAASTTAKTTGQSGTTTKSKRKPNSRPMSKVASSKHRRQDSRQRYSKQATVKRPPPSSQLSRERHCDKSSSDDSDSEREERPQTPTKIAVGDNMLPLIERDFPFCHVSPSTLRRLWQKQLQQVTALTRSKVREKTSTIKKMADVEHKQNALLQIIKKELDHTKRMQCQLEQQREKVALKSNVHARRQAAARARRYYHDYELRMKAKLQRRRTREEQIFKRTFEEGLELQRERIRELKRYTKEKREEHAKKHQDQLESMENYYRDQLAMLSESMVKERRECTVRDKAQNQMVQKMKRELRQKMESEIKELQQCLDKEEDVAHFRELDARIVRNKLSRITFTTTVQQ